MSLVSEALTRAKSDIHRGQDLMTDTRWLELFNEGLRDHFAHSEIRETSTTTAVAQYQSLVGLPSDFLDIRQIRWSTDRELTPYTETELDEEQDGWQMVLSANPDRYLWETWNQIRLYPRPSAAGTLTIRYAYLPATLIATDTIPWPRSYDDAMESYLAANASYLARDYDNATMFWNEYQERLKEAKAKSRAEQRSQDTYLTQRPAHVTNQWMWRRGVWSG